MEKKITKVFVDEGFGFKVRLLNVRMIKVRGQWTPNINYNKLAGVVLQALAHKPSRLTGAEIHFIRQHFGMTLQAFAKRFCVSHPAVMKWEKAGIKPTAMSWATEKDLRLFTLSKTGSHPVAVAELYSNLEREAPTHTNPVEIDAGKMAA
jgi:hypothetical protein